MANPPRAPRKFNWGLDIAPAAALGLLALWMLCPKPPASEKAPKFADAPVPGPRSGAGAAEPYQSLIEQDLAQRDGPLPAGFVPEAPAPPAPRKREEPAPVLDARGPDFNRMIGAELKRLTLITRRYHKENPKVREVDKAFGSLPRYMAVRKRYLEQHDAYAFAHDTLALPEVRQTVKKYASDPNVWRLALSMMREALKEKPPKPLYDEMKRFFTQDKQTVEFAAELSAEVMPRMGKLLPQVIASGEDLKPLQDLAKDLHVGKDGFSIRPGLGPVKGRAPPAEAAKPVGDGVPALPPSELKIGENDKQREQQLKDLGKGSRPKRR
ncbi:MAG: hypothetical protein HY928_09800 [Elusimicrobia bacterium]|nr:hypothetical protein [Elusimicrobiota bacterium]